MFNHYRAEGVILSCRNIREGDMVFTVYTKEFGRISVLGRSIRKNNSKLKMKMSIFALVEIGFISGKNYNTLVDVESKDNFISTKNSLAKLSFFYQLTETFLSLVIEEEKDEQIYFLLVETFKTINKSKISSDNLKLFYCLFCFRLLYFLGHKLYTTNCIFCNLKIEQECYFKAEEGGVVCCSCFSNKKNYQIPQDTNGFIYLENIVSLQSFLKPDIEKLFKQENNIFVKILDEYLSTIPKQKMLK